MTPKEFISAKIDQLIELFPKIRVRYECDGFSGTHTVEIIPQSEYNNEAMMDWQGAVFEEFFSLYPAEAICFITEDALVGIEKAEIVKTGTLFVNADYTVSNVHPVSINRPKYQPVVVLTQGFSSYGLSGYKFSENPYSAPITTTPNYSLAA
jgi:hypothetical protein